MESNIQSKSNPFTLSSQVKAILQSKGYTSIFNFRDYDFFKRRCAQAFDKAQAIAQRFMEEAEPQQNDFSEYTY